MADAAILQRQGLPALPVVGLALLRDAALDKFCEVFDVRRLGGDDFALEDDELEEPLKLPTMTVAAKEGRLIG